MLKRLGLFIAALTLLLAACGGGSGLSAEEQTKVDELVTEMMGEGEGGVITNEADARCYAEGIVGEFGIDRINELDTGEGLEAGFELMTAAEQEKVVDLAFGCIDLAATITEGMADSGLTEDQMACVSDGLTEDLLRGLLLAEIRGEDPTESEELMGVVFDCLMP